MPALTCGRWTGSAAIALGSTSSTSSPPPLLVLTPLIPAITLSWALTIKVREDEARSIGRALAAPDAAASSDGMPYLTHLLSPRTS